MRFSGISVEIDRGALAVERAPGLGDYKKGVVFDTDMII